MVNQDRVDIVLVEDNPDHVHFINRYLKPEKFNLTIITDGKKAVEYLESPQNKPDVVLLDYHLPSLDGLDILKHFQERNPEFAFIFLTVDDNIETAIEAMKAGASDFIPKSRKFYENLPSMVEKVRKIQAGKRERKQIEQALKESEEKHRFLFEKGSDAIILINATSEEIIECNTAAEHLYGYNRDQLLSLKFPYLVADPDGTGVSTHKSEDTSMYHKKQNGTVFPVELTDNVFNWQGNNVRIAAVRDISERKFAEDKLKSSLKEKEILLQEIHHRVKNNMQVISSLLKLQSDKTDNEETKRAIFESRNRVYTMSAVHETLYGTENLASIDVKTYLSKVAKSLLQTYQSEQGDVHLNITADELNLGIRQASPLGLILNELISNSLKYAFPGDKKGEISISVKKAGNQELEISISDNGIGFSETLDWQNSETLGLQLVTTLVKDQLNGTIQLNGESGTTFTIKFAINPA